MDHASMLFSAARTPARAALAAGLTAVTLFAAGMVAAPAAHAGAVFDGTTGAAMAGVSRAGNFTIAQADGSVGGSNLFHSFRSFGVATGESATFTTSSLLNNVIARVTGIGGTLTASTIDGLLKLDATGGGGTPAFYLINPKGVVFSANASVDVPGAFHVTTADRITFSNGQYFSATDTAGSSLSIASPASFGFLPVTTGGTVSVTGNTTVAPNIGATTSGGLTNIVAGHIVIDDAVVDGGRVRLIAVGNGAETVPVSTAFTRNPAANNGGNITVTTHAGSFAAAKVEAFPGDGVVGIEIDGASLAATGDGTRSARISTQNFSGDGGIDVNVGHLSLVNRGQIWALGVFGGHTNGSVNVNVTDPIGTPGDPSTYPLLIDSGGNLPSGAGANIATGIASSATTGVDGGSVTVRAQGIKITGAGDIRAHTGDLTVASDVTVEADEILIKDNYGRGIVAASFGKAPPGDVDLTVGKSLTIENGGIVSSSSVAIFDAQNLTIHGCAVATIYCTGNNPTVLLDGKNNATYLTAILSSAGTDETNNGYGGDAGNIVIDSGTGSVSILGGAKISTETWGAGTAGNIEIDASSVTVSGSNSKISSQTNTWIDTVPDPDVRMYSNGQTGNIQITATSAISVGSGAKISIENPVVESDAAKLAALLPTAIVLTAPSVTINGGEVTAATTGNVDAGSVTINASGSLTIGSVGKISSSTAGLGDAGQIDISAGNMVVDGNSTITTSAAINGGSPTGDAGDINVVLTGDLRLGDTGNTFLGGSNGYGSIASSTANASGAAGTVDVAAANIDIIGGEFLTSSGIFATSVFTTSSGKIGQIRVGATGTLSVREGGGILARNESSVVPGGFTQPDPAIRVVAPTISLSNSGRISAETLANDAGDIVINAGTVGSPGSGSLNIAGGVISGSTFGAGSGGTIDIDTDGFTMNGGSITSKVALGSASGNAGDITISALGTANLSNAAIISTDTLGSGNAGQVSLLAAALVSNGGKITSAASVGSTGDAGAVTVTAPGGIALTGGGEISSATYGAGAAGTVTIPTVTNLLISGAGSSINALAGAGSSGRTSSLNISASNSISLLNGGKLSIQNDATVGLPGAIAPSTLTVTAPTITLSGGGQITAATSGNVSAGAVNVTAATTLTGTGGTITSATTGAGNAGSVTVSTGTLDLDSGTITTSTSGSGNAGNVSVTAATVDADGLQVLSAQTSGAGSGNAGSVSLSSTSGAAMILGSGSQIATDTFGSGEAGDVTVSAASLLLTNGRISSVARPGSTGDAGAVTVTAPGGIALTNGGEISSATYGAGAAGTVTIPTVTNLLISGAGSSINALAGAGSSGRTSSLTIVATNSISLLNGGKLSIQNDATVGVPGAITPSTLTVTAPTITLNGGGQITAATSGNVSAGTVNVSAPTRLAMSGGTITSSTAGAGNAGSVQVTAGEIAMADGEILSQAQVGSSGDAGTVSVVSAGSLSMLDNSRIATDTFGSGDAGSVSVTAASLFVDPSEISSSAGSTAAGDAGNVQVTVAGSLELVAGGVISSATASPTGSAGTVDVSAGSILVDGSSGGTASSINAAATAGSSGQVGSVTVTTPGALTISNGGLLSIQNGATVADPSLIVPTTLSVSAGSIAMNDGQITAAAAGNVSASNIAVSAPGGITMIDSAILTSAVDGNGGSITVDAGSYLQLTNSQISTSVLGLLGNGGNIDVTATFILLETGFIQANTAAANALGGDVSINADLIVPSGNNIFLGGNTPYTFTSGVFGFNVIQAAAPTGLSGNINVTAPQLDLTGALAGLSTAMIDFGALGKDQCRLGAGSSLTPVGRGGLPPSARDMIRPEGKTPGARGEAPQARIPFLPNVSRSAAQPGGVGAC